MKLLATALGAVAAIMVLSGCANDRYANYGYPSDRYGYRDGYRYNGDRDRDRYDRDRFDRDDRDRDRDDRDRD